MTNSVPNPGDIRHRNQARIWRKVCENSKLNLSFPGLMHIIRRVCSCLAIIEKPSLPVLGVIGEQTWIPMITKSTIESMCNL